MGSKDRYLTASASRNFLQSPRSPELPQHIELTKHINRERSFDFGFAFLNESKPCAQDDNGR